MIFDVKETVDANSRSKAIRKAQLEYRQEFIEIASDLESQYINELQKLFDVYDGIAKQLQASRKNVQNMIQTENSMNKCLLEIRKELVGIQTSLF